MTFHNESRKVHQVVLGMSLSSQLLKRGEAMCVYCMQLTDCSCVFLPISKDFVHQTGYCYIHSLSSFKSYLKNCVYRLKHAKFCFHSQ